MELGGRGEERGRLGGPPSLLHPSYPPPTPQSLWPPGARGDRREGRRRAAGEGGREPAGPGRGAGAGGGGGGGRRREEGGRRGGGEEAETLHGNRIPATNSIHHQKTPLGRGPGQAGGEATGGGSGSLGATRAGRGSAASSAGPNRA